MPVYDQHLPPCYYYSEPQSYPSPPTYVRPSTNLPNRLQYTGRQRWLLNEIYQHVPYPNSVQKNVIADRVGATREQIRKSITSELRQTNHLPLGIWFQNRRRLAVQGHRAAASRSNPLPVDNGHQVQLELEEILLDLDVHRNAPQRMPVGQGVPSRSARRGRAQRK